MDLEAYVDVVPWLLFMIIDRQSGLGVSWAAASAAACGLGIAAWSHWRRRRTPIGWVALATFGCLIVVGVAANRPTTWFEPVIRSGSVAVLAGAALASLGQRPLSEAYTVDRVSPSRRAEPAFAAVNRRITAAWAVAAVLVAASFGAEVFAPSSVGLTVFDWVLPIAVVACAVRWVAVQWTAYLVWTEGPTGTSTTDASLTTLPIGREAVAPPTVTPAGSITYLHGVRAGH